MDRLEYDVVVIGAGVSGSAPLLRPATLTIK